jgi:thioredoxin-related protein
MVDLTHPGDYENSIKKRFNIRGVPTIILIDGTGTEIEELRVTGFIVPEEFASRLERIAH